MVPQAQTALEKAEETCTKRLQAMAEDHKKQLGGDQSSRPKMGVKKPESKVFDMVGVDIIYIYMFYYVLLCF